MKLFILAALLATASASVTSAEVRLNDNTGASVAAIRYNSVDRLVVADLTVPGQAQANTAEVSDFLAKFHGEFDQLKKEMESVKKFIRENSGKIQENAGDIDTLEDRADEHADNLEHKARVASSAIDALNDRMDTAIEKINKEAKERHADTNAAAALMAEKKGEELIRELQLQKQSLINGEIQAVKDAALQAQQTADAKVTLTKVTERLKELKQSLVQNEIKLAQDTADQAQNTADAKATLAQAEAKVDAAIKELAIHVTKAQNDAAAAQQTADAKTTLTEVAKEINDATNKLVNGEIKVALDAAALAQKTAEGRTTLQIVRNKIAEAVTTLENGKISTAQSAADAALSEAKKRATLQDVQSAVDGAIKTLAEGAVRTAQTAADDAMNVASDAKDIASAAATMQHITAEVNAAASSLDKSIKAAQGTADTALSTANARTTLKEVEDKIKTARKDIQTAIDKAHGEAISMSSAYTDAKIQEAKKTQITLKQVTDKVNAAKKEVARYIAQIDNVCGPGKEIDAEAHNDRSLSWGGWGNGSGQAHCEGDCDSDNHCDGGVCEHDLTSQQLNDLGCTGWSASSRSADYCVKRPLQHKPCKDCVEGMWAGAEQSKCVACRQCPGNYVKSAGSNPCDKTTGSYKCELCTEESSWEWSCPFFCGWFKTTETVCKYTQS